MSTELEKQINSQIRNNELSFLAQRSSFSKISKKGRVSFLFNTNIEFYGKKGVSSQNRIPIYEDINQLGYLGERGLSEIESLNAKVAQEEFSSLFQVNELISIQYLTQDEATQRLDRLKKLIDYLVPYFLLDSAKICIEYLIQAYDIHILLGEYLFLSFLPYHDMSEFSTLVQILEIPDSSGIKGLADSIKNTKTIISSRNQLSVYLIKNITVFNLLVNFWEEKLFNYNLTKNVALTNLITWLTIEIIDELSKTKDSKNIENCLRNIIDIIVLSACFKNFKYEDLRCTGYCILFKLANPLLNLSFEIQTRIIRETFLTVFLNQKSNNLLSSFAETLLLINHLLIQLKTMLHLKYLDSEVSRLILDNSNLFIDTIDQLIKWDSNILQVLSLTIRSILNFGFNLDNEYSECCTGFIKKLLQNIYNNKASFEEKYSKIIKVIVLNCIDIYTENDNLILHFDHLIHILYQDFPSEFISALSFSLNLSNTQNKYFDSKKEKIKLFINKALKENHHDEHEKNTKMLLSLLNSQDKKILESCIEAICNLIVKSEKDLCMMNNIEKQIFDVAIRYYFETQNLFSQIDEYLIKLFKLSGTVKIIQFLDRESDKNQESWRTLLAIKGILSYFKMKISSISTLKAFLSKEINPDNKNSQSLINFHFLKIFGENFESKWIILFKNMKNLLEESNLKQNRLDSLLGEYSDIFLPFLTIISNFEFSFNKELRNIASKLLKILYSTDRIESYLNGLLNQNQFHYLELILILFLLEENENGISNIQDSLRNSLFSKIKYGNDQILSLLELLYYKLYYLIQNIYIKTLNQEKKGIYTNGIFVIKILRSIFARIIPEYLFNLSPKLLNIALIDTLDIQFSKKSELPSFQLFLCFCNSEDGNLRKMESLIANLSINLLNILSNHSNIVEPLFKLNIEMDSSHLFYGKNIYYETLVSHSYSFLEILISKLKLKEYLENKDDLCHFIEVVYNLLVFSVLPVLSNQDSGSIRIASIKLCKSIKEKLGELDQNSLEFKSNLKKIICYDKKNKFDSLGFRSCYLNEKGISLNQVLSIINDILLHQTEIVVELKNYYFIERKQKDSIENLELLDCISRLNLIMIMELTLDQWKLFDIDYLLNYIKDKLIYINTNSEYHKITVKFLNLLKSDKIHKITNIQILFAMTFVRQSIENLKLDQENLNFINNIFVNYCDEIRSFDKGLIFKDLIETNSDINDIFGELLISTLQYKVLKNLSDGVDFVTSIIFLIANYTPKKMKRVSLSQLGENCLNILDSLITNIIKSCIENYYELKPQNNNTPNLYLKEQIIIQWLYEEINNFSISKSRHLKNEEIKELKFSDFNEDFVNQILKYMDLNKNKIKSINNKNFDNESFDLNNIVKTEFYLIGILEYGIKNRIINYKNTQKIINYFDNSDYRDFNQVFGNPMIISSITCLFTNMNFESCDEDDSIKAYFNVYQALCSIYRNFIKSIKKSFTETNYLLKMTFYSLNLFIRYNLESCKYFDNQYIKRIKNVLFNIIIEKQVNEIVEFSQFTKIGEILVFMETLHNQVIYKQENVHFNKSQGIFVIINHYLSNNIQNNTLDDDLSNNEQIDALLNYLFEENLLENKISIYNNLFESILNQIEILMKHEGFEDRLESKKFILSKLLIMTKAITCFLNRTFLNIEINFNECFFLIGLLDKLILLKTLTSKHILKKWIFSLEENEDLNLDNRSARNKLKLRIDRLERNYLNLENSFKLNNSDSVNYKKIQGYIDDLINIIIENHNMKKYLILNWDFSKEDHFHVSENLNRRFEQSLFNNRIEYLGIVLKEVLDNKLKIEFDDHKQEKIENLSKTMKYLLNQIISIDLNLKKDSNTNKDDSRIKMKIWIKSWYVFDLILKVSDSKNREKLCKLLFLKVIEFYQSCETDHNLGIKFKIPIIQNFLIYRINEFDSETSISMLNEIEIIALDTIKTIKYLNNEQDKKKFVSNDISNERKIINMLFTMINSYYNITTEFSREYQLDEIKSELLLPYLTLLNNLFNSKIGTVILTMEKIRKQILFDILLNDKLLNYFELKNLTKILKSEKIKMKKFINKGSMILDDNSEKNNSNLSELKYKFYNNELDKNLDRKLTLENVIENKLIKLLLLYCKSFSSSFNENSISIFSKIVSDISSNIFTNLNLDEVVFGRMTSDYSRLTLLMIITSFSLNFIDASKLLNNKNFIEKFSHFYLLLINLLIINFMKLYSNKENNLKKQDSVELSRNQNFKENLSKKKKLQHINEDNNIEKEIKLFSFISNLLGDNILNSHGLINDHWIGINMRDFKKINETHDIIQLWELESSILTLLSVFVLKLSAKKLREFTFLVKKLIHRNGESLLSKINDIRSEQNESSNNKHKSVIKDLYNEFSINQNVNMVKDIYSCRIWTLILLTIIDTTGDYGVYCLIDDIALDTKSINDLIQMNALTCVQNNTIIQYKNAKFSNKKSSNYQQIANLNQLSNDYGWFWYHLGIYNLLLIKFIYRALSNQEDESKDIPNSIEDHLINPIITNLDMFALFDNKTYKDQFGCGEQWNLILNDIWIYSIKYFRNNDLIIASIVKSLVNKLKNGNDKVRIFSANTLLLLWKDEICSITILSHLSDLLPTIKELLSDNLEEMIHIIKSIVKKIEERTGKEISKQLVH